eukprot:CAMPEP_0114690644 /NCGR_PEP_ID=MMETSP0191-20121206/65941_1 /TAXON_ID=126664 /ORGANISM="Sorites sp." /LENGTH=419 /DNA_ID=CAMNT_0001980847 /DNA_START=42 /DNA_END=1302 /DNA_ORIENTATION=+
MKFLSAVEPKLWASLPSEADALHSMQTVALHVQELLPPKVEEVTLFRYQDWFDWMVFAVTFGVLVCVDNLLLFGKYGGNMDFKKALSYSVFWLVCAAGFKLVCAAGFNGYIYWSRGEEAAFDWGTGYLLEWMLSVDNLFVFRSIFLIFHTPSTHKHKPLFWGICGAICFRMAFFVVGEVLMHAFWATHFVLGFFLIYTGYKILGMEEDDEDEPNQNPIFLWMIKKIKLIDSYSPEPKFFAQAAVDEKTQEPVLPDWSPRMLPKDCDVNDPTKGRDLIYGTYATRLELCLELTDVAFAVDSVSAIIAQIPDLFLAYTACVFAMLGLRATFFAVDELVKLFTLLPYAVSVILMFIGAKLVLRGWIHIPAEVVCATLMGVLLVSIVASVIFDYFKPKKEGEDEVKPYVSPLGSPCKAEDTDA